MPRWTAAAALLWAGVLIAVLLRAGLHPHRPTSLATYLTGGAAWRAGQPLYTNWRGFVYPPVIGFFFSLFTLFPPVVAAVLWRMMTAGGFLLGLGAMVRAGVFLRIPPGRQGLVFVAVLPLSIGNLDNAQANPLIAGLMMLAVAALQWEAWSLCAISVAIAATFKIYPVALALLLCLVRPRQLWWRIPLSLVIMALLPFAVQRHDYVARQYHAWLETRLADNRFDYPMKDAPLDLWYLLVRLGGLPVSERAYTLLQAGGGVALAGLVLWRRRQGDALRDILAMLYLLVTLWMLLLGPATENQTYVVLAPAACLLAVESLGSRHPKAGSYPDPAPSDGAPRPRRPPSPQRPSNSRTWHSPAVARVLALSACGLLLAAVARNSLAPSLKSPGYMAVQPVAALVLLAAVFAGMGNSKSDIRF